MTLEQKAVRAAIANCILWPAEAVPMPFRYVDGSLSWYFCGDRRLSAEAFLDPAKVFREMELKRHPTAAEWRPIALRLIEAATRA